MRLPEAKIKEGILHPEKLARREALLHFANCYSRDAEVMPLAIQAIENRAAARHSSTSVGPNRFFKPLVSSSP